MIMKRLEAKEDLDVLDIFSSTCGKIRGAIKSGNCKKPPPILNVSFVDRVLRGPEGEVNLYIDVEGHLDGSLETQKMLRDKVDNYLADLNTDGFQEEFDYPPPEKTRVIISCDGSPDPVMHDLIEKMKPWVAENNARIFLRINQEK
jgi:hypothetical protein